MAATVGAFDRQPGGSCCNRHFGLAAGELLMRHREPTERRTKLSPSGADPLRPCDPRLPSAVRVGGMDRNELAEALHRHDVHLNRAAEVLLDDPRFALSARSEVVEIAAFSVAELGFDEGATYGQLVARALERGCGECPLELGPHLRMQFLDQPEGAAGYPATQHRAPPGSITVASPPLDDRDETPKGFYLRRIDGVLWLRGYWASRDNVWRPEDTLVFARDGRSA